jgi:hypothetical protein
MAVTINGDGTISGIGVGGLPDGVVDSGTLATGIDATKLADGTVTSAELQYINSLSSNAQTQINAGGVTQVALVTKAFDLATATGTFNITGLTFTPVFVYVMANKDTTLAVSHGFGTGSGQRILFRKADANDWSTLTSQIATYWPSGSHRQQFYLNSLNSDGATIGHAKVAGSPSGTFTMYMYFMR